MAKAELKTKPNAASVEKFLATLTPEQQSDSAFLLKEMARATKSQPKMWGTSIIGFGDKEYKSERSGREVDWFLIGFSPRKTNLSLYVLCGAPRQEELLKDLGKHKRGQGCLYIRRLEDVDTKVLRQLIQESVDHLKS